MANRCGCNDPEVDITAGDSARMVALWHTKYLHDKARLSVKNCDNCLEGYGKDNSDCKACSDLKCLNCLNDF